MKNWYNSLSPSERVLVSYGSVVVLLILSWLLIAKPLYNSHTKLNKAIQQQHKTLAIMQKQSLQIKQLQQQGLDKPVASSNQNPQQLIERSLQTWRLKSSLERMQSQGSRGVRLILKNANADRVMRFLHELENMHTLSIASMAVDSAKNEAGTADFRLTIQRPRNQ